MINQRIKNTFYFNDILHKTSLKEVQISGINYIQFEDLQKVWIGFVNYVFDQIKLNRRVKVFDFFIIGSSKTSQRIQLEFVKTWLKKNELSQMILEIPPIIPIKKVFPQNIQKYTDLTLEEVDISIKNIFSYIEEQLINTIDDVELELKYLGKLNKLGDIISFTEYPSINKENQQLQYQITDFLQMHQSNLKQQDQKNLNFKSTRLNFLQKKKLAPIKSFLCLDVNQNQTEQKLNTKNQIKKLDGIQIIKRLQSFQKKDLATHPLSLDQNFSKLVNDPKSLYKSLLQKPNLFKQPAPLLFDCYSHTKACPLNLQYNSFSISSRIAINYTPLSKYLYLDYETQKILVLYNKENKALFLRQSSELEQNKKKSPEELSKDRYNQYINDFIYGDQNIEFPEKSFLKILDQDYSKYKYLLPQDLEEQKENLKREIKEDFNLAIKKVLLDYILKEDEEKLRLGIQKIINPIVEYGQGKYRFQMKQMPNTFQQRKIQLERNLILYQETTHKIVDCWFCIKENSNFVLNSFEEKPVTLQEFQDIQREQMSNLRQSLQSVWVKEISQIYQKNLLNQSKKEIRKYFDCIGNVISQQVRELVVNSIKDYLRFMKMYKRNNYKTVEQCLLENQQLFDPLQKSFLILQLKEIDGKIIFDKDLESVKEELIKILEESIENSENISRPENFFYRSDKDDKIILDAIDEIELVIQNNFEQIIRAKTIFKKFEHLFIEGEILDKILKNEEANINRYFQLYQKYNLIKDQVVDQVPQNIYMNFARIDCSGLKKRFLQIIENLNQKIKDRALEEITFLTQQIDITRKKSLNDVSVQIDSVEKLIKAEQHLEEYHQVKFIFIKENFEKIIDWYKNFYIGTCKLNKDVYIDIQSTIQKIQTMDQEIQKETKRIKQERERLEKSNKNDKEIIANQLKLCRNCIKEFKTKGKKYEMNNLIPIITNTVTTFQQGEKKIKVINKEEELLGFPISSFKEFKEVGRILKIFEDLWKMIEDWEEKKKNWESSDIFSLNPKFIKKDIQEKLIKIQQIISDFNEMNPIPQPPLHLTEELQRAIQNFKEDAILLEALCAKGIENRHWDQINEILSKNKLNFVIDSTNSYVIKTIRDSGIKQYTTDIQTISDFAVKEFQNKQILDSIEEELHLKKIELISYSIRDSYVIKMNQVNDIEEMFKSFYQKFDLMKNQDHAIVHNDRIEKLTQKIKNVEQAFNYWLIVQNLWIHLEPIFTTEEYLEHLPEQYQQFAQANQGFLKFMKERKENTNIVNLGEYANYMKKLTVLRKLLKSIHRKLEAFILKQNMPFPKFYSVLLNSEIEIKFADMKQDQNNIQKQNKLTRHKSFGM